MLKNDTVALLRRALLSLLKSEKVDVGKVGYSPCNKHMAARMANTDSQRETTGKLVKIE